MSDDVYKVIVDNGVFRLILFTEILTDYFGFKTLERSFIEDKR
jgi:hypothetical protein